MTQPGPKHIDASPEAHRQRQRQRHRAQHQQHGEQARSSNRERDVRERVPTPAPQRMRAIHQTNGDRNNNNNNNNNNNADADAETVAVAVHSNNNNHEHELMPLSFDSSTNNNIIPFNTFHISNGTHGADADGDNVDNNHTRDWRYNSHRIEQRITNPFSGNGVGHSFGPSFGSTFIRNYGNFQVHHQRLQLGRSSSHELMADNNNARSSGGFRTSVSAINGSDLIVCNHEVISQNATPFQRHYDDVDVDDASGAAGNNINSHTVPIGNDGDEDDEVNAQLRAALPLPLPISLPLPLSLPVPVPMPMTNHQNAHASEAVNDIFSGGDNEHNNHNSSVLARSYLQQTHHHNNNRHRHRSGSGASGGRRNKHQIRRSLKSMNKFLRKTVYTLRRIKSLMLQQVQLARSGHLNASEYENDAATANGSSNGPLIR